MAGWRVEGRTCGCTSLVAEPARGAIHGRKELLQHSPHGRGKQPASGTSSTRTQQSPLQHKAHANQRLEAPKVMELRAEEISSPLHLYLGHLLPLWVTVTISCSQGHIPLRAGCDGTQSLWHWYMKLEQTEPKGKSTFSPTAVDLCSGPSSNSSLAEAENPSQNPFPLFSYSQQFGLLLTNFIIFELPIEQLQYTVLSTTTMSDCPRGACVGLDVL